MDPNDKRTVIGFLFVLDERNLELYKKGHSITNDETEIFKRIRDGNRPDGQHPYSEFYMGAGSNSFQHVWDKEYGTDMTVNTSNALH